jgi:hypothetical protein
MAAPTEKELGLIAEVRIGYLPKNTDGFYMLRDTEF